jgi:hypothetical protein
MKRQTAYKLRKAIEQATISLPDDTAVDVPELFPAWKPDHTYSSGERVQDEGLLYRCVQPHTSQADWKPGITPALWALVDNPAEEWPEWRQPTGAQDAYASGAKVSHNSKHWVSTADNNVWEPGVYGWDEVAE